MLFHLPAAGYRHPGLCDSFKESQAGIILKGLCLGGHPPPRKRRLSSAYSQSKEPRVYKWSAREHIPVLDEVPVKHTPETNPALGHLPHRKRDSIIPVPAKLESLTIYLSSLLTAQPCKNPEAAFGVKTWWCGQAEETRPCLPAVYCSEGSCLL